MARIVVIQHHTGSGDCRRTSLRLLLDTWEREGHQIHIARGIDRLPDGDVAILHVDLSVVPDAYVAAAKQYPRVVNGAALDIRKRNVSRNLLSRGDDWAGSVVVKTDLNANGWPEWYARRRAQDIGGSLVDSTPPLSEYQIYRHLSLVPELFWSTPGIVVERFLPERDEKGFYLRTWLFFHDRERCRRFLSHEPLVKGGNILSREPSSVPDFIRGERKRLGLDYGKMDFVIHNGRAILLDANTTPAAPPPSPDIAAGYAHLAGGLDALLASPAAPEVHPMEDLQVS